jgi:hypothetical protein
MKGLTAIRHHLPVTSMYIRRDHSIMYLHYLRTVHLRLLKIPGPHPRNKCRRKVILPGLLYDPPGRAVSRWEPKEVNILRNRIRMCRLHQLLDSSMCRILACRCKPKRRLKVTMRIPASKANPRCQPHHSQISMKCSND